MMRNRAYQNQYSSRSTARQKIIEESDTTDTATWMARPVTATEIRAVNTAHETHTILINL
jgi:hypothetical protein